MRLDARLLPKAGSDGARALGLTVLGIMAGTAAVTAIAACLILSLYRYEIAVGADGVYRFDRWEGEANICLPKPTNPLQLSCSGHPGDWIDVPKK